LEALKQNGETELKKFMIQYLRTDVLMQSIFSAPSRRKIAWKPIRKVAAATVG
jgi:hypothetical protein